MSFLLSLPHGITSTRETNNLEAYNIPRQRNLVVSTVDRAHADRDVGRLRLLGSECLAGFPSRRLWVYLILRVVAIIP